jgi:hypothetical protein
MYGVCTGLGEVGGVRVSQAWVCFAQGQKVGLGFGNSVRLNAWILEASTLLLSVQ